MAKDEHAGWTGVENRQNTYHLNLEAMPATVAPYYLRARVHGASGNDSRGEIVFRKMD